MAFQSAVNFRYTGGFPGQIVREVPHVVKSWRLTAQTAQPNTFGFAFTYAGDGATPNGSMPVQTAQVGQVGTGAFAGILCNPQEFALEGTTSAGALAPSLVLPPNSEAQLITVGNVVVVLPAAADYGAPVYFNNTTGALAVTAGAGFTLIPGAKVENTITAAGPTTISLSGQVPVPAP